MSMRWRVPEILLGGLLVCAAAMIGFALRAMGVGQDTVVLPPFSEATAEPQIAFWTMALAIFTLILGGATILLFVYTRRTAQHAIETSVRELRAYVSAGGVMGFINLNSSSGKYEWRLRVDWVNSGKTPTRNLLSNVSAIVSDTPLPVDTLFEYASQDAGQGLIAPRTSMRSGQTPIDPISADVLNEIIAGTKWLYVWGWARYNDVFPKTELRVTRFSYIVGATGDAVNFDPKKDMNGVQWSWTLMAVGNSMDE